MIQSGSPATPFVLYCYNCDLSANKHGWTDTTKGNANNIRG